MSSLKTNNNRRPVLPNPRVLRKQKSLIETGLITQGTNSIIRTDRQKYPTLKRQLSIDQLSSRNFRSKYSGSARQNGIVDGSGGHHPATIAGIETSSGVLKGIPLSKHTNGSASNKLIKNSGCGDDRKETKHNERLRKNLKGSDDRINLNIFLAQNTGCADEDSVVSDLECSTDSSEIRLHEGQQLKYSSTSSLSSVSPPDSALPNSRAFNAGKLESSAQETKTAAARRRQFQTNREIYSITRQNSGQITGITATKIERSHPPLVRAMSAPIRSFDENNKNILANKRKPRRRKLFGTKTNIISEKSDDDCHSVIESSKTGGGKNQSDCDESLNEKNTNKNNKKSLGRSKGTLGCDIETLVSLISLDGSDSEKEDSNTANSNINNNNSPPPVIITNRRPPFLRKSGKSVSFQEDDINNSSSTHRGFAHIIRRGSVAPLAARIRANRPPTAPAGSIYIRNMENNYTAKTNSERENENKTDTNTTCSKPENNNQESSENKEASNEEKPNPEENEPVPEGVRTTKERECWRLWQKMARKGVAVSFDTVLRGMLTPTELRLRQKQQDLEEAKKAKEESDKLAAEAAAAAAVEEANRKSRLKVFKQSNKPVVEN